MTTNAITPAPKRQPTIRDRLEGPEFRKAVAAVLPKHLTPERFLRVAILAITRTPSLAKCDQASFFGALMSLSQLGLEPDGRRAHLIPFENRKRNCTECQLIVDWKGLAELAMRSGLVSSLHADVVCEGDQFDYNIGKVRNHVPWFLRRDSARPDGPGKIFAAYALAEFRDGSTKAEVLSIAEVESVRSRSPAGKSGPWVTDFSEMAKKTAFRRLSKWLPLSPEFRDAADADSDQHIEPAINVPTVQIRETPFEISQSSEPEPTQEAPAEQALPADPADELPGLEPKPKAKAAEKLVGLKAIRRRLAVEDIKESGAVETIHRMFPEAGGCNTLDEVEQLLPNVINAIVRSLDGFIRTIRGGAEEVGL